MFRFFESIRIEDGKAWNLPYHDQRVMRTINDLCGSKPAWNLGTVLAEAAIPDQGLYKCRVSYDQLKAAVEFDRYTIRPVNSLKLVEANGIEYAYKYTHRTELEKLLAMRGQADDVLIVKNGFVTDTTFANLVLMDARGDWYTPADCLLKGTMRQSLLDSGRIAEASIAVGDLRRFVKFKAINALRDWRIPESEVSNID
jgi:4-amino-4-deoxychorismate lyase